MFQLQASSTSSEDLPPLKEELCRFREALASVQLSGALSDARREHWQGGTAVASVGDTDSLHKGESGTVDGGTRTGEVHVEDADAVERRARGEGAAGAHIGGTAGELVDANREAARRVTGAAGKVGPGVEGK
ncbi:hypothetical protein MTO96_042942 [Rhipicephalus appendiculatus]